MQGGGVLELATPAGLFQGKGSLFSSISHSRAAGRCDFAPKEKSAVLGDILGCHNQGDRGGCALPASSVERPGMLPNIRQCPSPLPTTSVELRHPAHSEPRAVRCSWQRHNLGQTLPVAGAAGSSPQPLFQAAGEACVCQEERMEAQQRGLRGP